MNTVPLAIESRYTGSSKPDNTLKKGMKNVWDWDKKIPVALIATMIFQTVAFLIVGTSWVQQTNSRLEAVENFMRKNEQTDNRIVRLEESIKWKDQQIQELRNSDAGTIGALRELQQQINTITRPRQ